MLETGLKNEKTITVTEKDTALTHGSGTLEVFATPAMIALIENTAMESVSPFLEEGSATVGTKLNIEHVSATPVGCAVTCETELIEIDRRRLVFTATVSDNAGPIGKGTHERFIVNGKTFMEKTAAKKV